MTFTHRDLGASEVVDALTEADLELDGTDATTVAVTLLDTFDGRLHADGLRLVLREGTERELVLVGADEAPPAHLVWSGPAPQRDHDLPPGPFGARVAGPLAERALLPVVAVRSSCRQVVGRDGRGKAVVTLLVHDRPATAEPDAALPGVVVEVRGLLGHGTEVDRAVRHLERLGFERHDGDLVDLALQAAGRSAEGFSSSPTVPLDPADDALDAVRAVLRNLLDTVEANLPGTLDDLDPEFLHELRVAVRRTRSVLSETKKVLPHEVRDRFRTGFGELGAATGRTRDLDVYVLGWGDLVATLDASDRAAVQPLLDALDADRRRAQAKMARVLSSTRTAGLLADWRAWLDDAEVEPDSRSRTVGDVIASRIDRAQSVLLDEGRAITPDSPAEALHDLRKDAKKLRYLLECFGSLFPAPPRKAFVGQLKALQDNLGTFQDLEVQINELRELAHVLHSRSGTSADTLLATGRLIDHLEQARHRERDDFVDRFAAYDTSDNRRRLADLLATVEGS